ncbi:tetratricopeptide repeat protein [Plantactinospora sp. WMMB782]|uniref:serine/threonine-protein kinase n=1 Tax=Plantactinospora sp. WMMB782 TaxID=3404121 RepID=UPI003B939C25
MVGETGFCDSCARRPLPPRPAGPPTTVTGSSGSHGPSLVIGGLVPMPELEPVDPVSRLPAGTGAPEPSRVCGRCGAEVGRARAGQPELLKGFCRLCGTPFSFPPMLRRGDLVAEQYEVDGCLARGGLGWVYLARDTHLDKNPVVLKGLISNDEVTLRLAVAERRFLTVLDHPNIVRIFNAVSHFDPRADEKTGYIVMEYLNGESLQQILEATQDTGPLPVEQVLAYGHEILAAIGYLHDRGLLYCDMKPANVIRCPDRIKVIDIGGVRRVDDHDREVTHTPFYEPPEREIRRYGPTVRWDIHTVGRTLQVLFQAGSEERRRYLIEPPEHPPERPFEVESFARLVERAYAEHDRRFATAAEMSQQLKGVLREILSMRTGRPHPVRSAVFAPTPLLLDGGLGAVPGLDAWITGAIELLDVAPPPPRQAVGGLPLPLVDPGDAAVDLLATAGAADPRGLIEKLLTSGLRSVEVRLALCRAYLEAGDRDSAAGALKAAVSDLGGRARHDWRIRWHQGLLELAGHDDQPSTGPGKGVSAARTEFDAVYSACPGEIAPKFALGFCAEHLAEYELAEHCYRAIWARDRSEGSAAFGLARLRLRPPYGDRAGAVRVLDEVPRETRDYERARVAAVRILCGRLPDGGPTVDDVAEAVRRLPALRLDGGHKTGESRDRLTALVRAAALDLLRNGAGEGLGDGDDVLGAEPTEHDLRRRLEESMRTLAGQARTRADHDALVDLANAVRPRTPW